MNRHFCKAAIVSIGSIGLGRAAIKYLAVIAIAVAVTLVASDASRLDAKERTLTTVHAEVQSKFETVRHVTSDAFDKLDRSNLVVFDVREDDEYAVSHLKEAIRVDPDIDADEFMRTYAGTFAGKTVIVYCSVGVRSSALAERIRPALKANGGNDVFNLTGGIFQWHNEARPLARGNQSTRYVHPYNRSWGRLISNRSLISYEPKQ